MSIISERLKELRDDKRLTQSEIADSIGLSRATYAMYEIGKSKPKPETLQKIADYYSVTVDYLLGSDMDKIDLIIQKVKELTDSNKLKWEDIDTYLNYSPYDTEPLMRILQYHNELPLYDSQNSYVSVSKGIHYILLKKESCYLFITAQDHTDKDEFRYEISSFKATSNEKNLMPLLQSVSTVQNRISDDFYNSILDNLNNLDTNKPDKT